MTTPPPETVLLLGNYHPALAVARSLDRSKYRCIVGSEGTEGCTEHSRFVSEVWSHPPLADKDVFLSDLLKLLRDRADLNIVFPIAEDFVVVLADIAAELPAELTIASPQPEVVHSCRDKTGMNSLARELGIGCEPYLEVHSYEEALAGAVRLRYPIVVRPTNSLVRIGNKKAVICPDEDAFRQRIPIWPDELEGLLLQRQAPGLRHNVYFAARDGQLLGHVDHRTLRTDRWDGTGLTVEGRCARTPTKLAEETAALVRALGYTGVGLTQFLADESAGKHVFLELNPRVGGNLAVVEGYGLEMSQSAINLARGLPLDPPRFRCDTIRFAWVTGDVAGLKNAIFRRELGFRDTFVWLYRLVVNAVRADLHATWRWDDPLPTVTRYLSHFSVTRRLRSLCSRRATGT